jgi:hypothetical protein
VFTKPLPRNALNKSVTILIELSLEFIIQNPVTGGKCKEIYVTDMPPYLSPFIGRVSARMCRLRDSKEKQRTLHYGASPAEPSHAYKRTKLSPPPLFYLPLFSPFIIFSARTLFISSDLFFFLLLCFVCSFRLFYTRKNSSFFPSPFIILILFNLTNIYVLLYSKFCLLRFQFLSLTCATVIHTYTHCASLLTY